MGDIQNNELLNNIISSKFLEEKLEISNKLSDWFLKIIIFFSALRILTSLIDHNVCVIQVQVSSTLLLILLPLYFYFQNQPTLKRYLSFICLWCIEPISTYYSFWIFPQYDILYGMGNTILLYYGLLEMAGTFYSGVMYISIHLITWILAGYYSGHIPYPQDSDTWFTILSVFLFHILFFKHRFDFQIESIKNKCIIDRKQVVINTIVQAIPEGVLVIDYKLNFLLKNNAFDVLVGAKLELEFVPQLRNCVGDVDGDLLQDVKRFCIGQQQKSVFGTVKVNGVLLEVTATKMMWEVEPAVILTFRDVTGLIRLEKEAVENASIVQTLRGVSHELKTPLNIMISKLKSALKQNVESVQEDLQAALSSAKFLLFSIRDIIDYSSIKFRNYTSHIHRTDLTKLLQDCINISSNFHGSSPSCIKIQLSSSSEEVSIDKPRFKQILVALLTKALNLSSTNEILLKLTEDAFKLITSILFSCKDNTVQSFISTQEFPDDSAEVQVNSGLLQELCKSIIQEVSHKSLQISFIPPNKFIFMFVFPVAAEIYSGADDEIPEEGVKMYPRPPLLIPSSLPSRVLVVDDMPINLQIAKSLLNSINVECVGVLSGEDAIRILKTQNEVSEKVKVVLMDCMMPEMDGWETTEKIHSLYREQSLKYLPYIIGHSAFENKADIEKCLKSGMDDFLPKPSPSSEYYNKISCWLAEPFRLGK